MSTGEPRLTADFINRQPRQRDFAYVWRWMRLDLPLRIVPFVALPVAWSVVWGSGIGTVGLQIPYGPTGWIWIGLLAVGVFAACVVFVRKALNWSASSTPGAMALELPFFLIVNPVAEEILFRGFFQSRLATLTGSPVALVVVSFVFGFHHAFAGFGWRFLLWATLGGLLFGTVAQQFSSIAPAILLHSAADLGIFLIGPWIAARRRLRPGRTRAAAGL